MRFHWRRYPRLLSTLLALLTLPAALHAQKGIDPIGMGTAGASAATARGLGSAVGNPATLDLAPLDELTLKAPVLLSLYNIGGSLGSTFLSSSEFNDIFDRPEGWGTAEARRRLGSLLVDERLFANGANNLIVAAYRTDAGTFSLHYGHRLFSTINFPAPFSRVLTEGELFDPTYEFVTRGIGAVWATELGLGYGIAFGGEGKWLPTVALGAEVKYLRGIVDFEVGENSMLRIDRVTAGGSIGYHVRGGYTVRSAEPAGFDPGSDFSQFQLGLFPAGAGSGFSFDVGVAGVLLRDVERRRDLLFFGFELFDVGTIDWSSNTQMRASTGIDDILPNAVLSNEQFARYEGRVDPIGSYTTAIPAGLRGSIGVDLEGLGEEEREGHMIAAIEGEVPLNNAPGNRATGRVGAGLDWGLSRDFALRGGLSYRVADGFDVALGAGVRPFDWLTVDLGVGSVNALVEGDRYDIALRIGAGFGD